MLGFTANHKTKISIPFPQFQGPVKLVHANNGNGMNMEPKETERKKKVDDDGDDLKGDNQRLNFDVRCWAVLIVSFAILVAALKYSLIVALLIFILITLLCTGNGIYA
ncbi:hypothetical protein Ancab_020732 [Ancistrocladus abbreviatus]